MGIPIPKVGSISYLGKRGYLAAFFKCELLLSVEFQDSVDVIEEKAFWNCSSLCKILIPPSVSLIEEQAFTFCSKLRTAILNDGLEEISMYAF